MTPITLNAIPMTERALASEPEPLSSKQLSAKQMASEQFEVTEEQVIKFLRARPNFFEQHDYLLRDLKVPHRNGAAISLGERQVQVFREHRDAMKNKLSELISVARENDQHFEKSKRLLLNLLEIKSLDEINMVLDETFKNDPKIDFSSVIVFGDKTDFPVSDIKVLDLKTAKEQLGALLESTNAVCGVFGRKQMECLFPEVFEKVGSAAIIPLRSGEILGLFCIGSKDAGHFESSMGSLFLSYISDFISRILPGLLLKSRSHKIVDQVPSLLE